jgi:hypothetical protein
MFVAKNLPLHYNLRLQCKQKARQPLQDPTVNRPATMRLVRAYCRRLQTARFQPDPLLEAGLDSIEPVDVESLTWWALLDFIPARNNHSSCAGCFQGTVQGNRIGTLTDVLRTYLP